ncbi:MAG: very short patch repair endonuclease [Kiloniellaceae bacterium]
MADPLTPELRSAHMAKIRGKDTHPELIVRRLLHSAGYRYRVHGYKLPGRPDLVFTGRKKVIFVHGCFWHHHKGCTVAHIPKTRSRYWKDKLEGNKARDKRNIKRLMDLGWASLVIWECETKDEAAVFRRLSAFLGPAKKESGTTHEFD